MIRRHGGFILVLLLQGALILTMPLRSVDDTGTTKIWLKVSADGRRDAMQGEYLRLRYEISDSQTVGTVSMEQEGESIYVIARRTGSDVWDGFRRTSELPEALREGQIAIRGKILERGRQIQAHLHQAEDGTWKVDSTSTGDADVLAPNSPDRTVAHAWVQRWEVGFPEIESYFIPANRRAQLVKDLQAHPDEISAQVQVDAEGRPALLQIRVQDRLYDF